MKSRLWGSVSACVLALVTALSSASTNQPLESHVPAVPGGTEAVYALSLTIGDTSSVPVAVWVVAIGLIGLVGIARRNSAGK